MRSAADPTQIQLKIYFTRHLLKEEVDALIGEIKKLLKKIFGRDYNGLYCELYNVVERGR